MRIECGFLILLVAMSLCGCGSGIATGTATTPANSSTALTSRDQVHERAAWTILIYLDADNDLESAGIANLNQMEAIGSTRDVHVLVQMDRALGYDESNGDWTDTRRYLVTRDSDQRTLHSIRMDTTALGELDMGNWRTLRDFVRWGIQESPSDNYCLVIWDHGTGWQIRLQSALPQYKYVLVDESSGSAMNIVDIPSALEGANISVLAFDACLMQQLEIAYQMRNSARYMVGSAAPEPSPGYNYYAWISRVAANTSPVDLCRVIVQQYAATYPAPRLAITQCAVDLSRIPDVAEAASTLADELMKHPASSAGITNAGNGTLNYSTAGGGPNRNYLDLVDFAGRAAGVIGADAQSSYHRLQETVRAAVVAVTHSSDLSGGSGLAIYVPPPGSYDPRYATIDLAEDTSWDEWLQAW